MANPDARFGLKPVRHLNGNPWNGATMRCYVSASYAVALFIGDPVVLETTDSNKATTVRCPTVIRSDGISGDFIFGVITSFEPDPDNLTYHYRPASTARYCNVCVDPDVIYHIRDAGTAAAKAVIGANAVGIFTHAGDTTTGLSGYELGTATAPAASAGYPLLILGVADIEDNEWDGSTDTNVIWEVMISLHQLRASSNSTGVLGVLSA